MSEAASLLAWRLVKRSYAASAFDGEGAYRHGGRWNSRGARVIYASSSLALAALEFLVHLDPVAGVPELLAFPVRITLREIEVAPVREASTEATAARLASINATRAIGNNWLRSGRGGALRVPSAVVVREDNFLLRPSLEGVGWRAETAESFAYDLRLMAGRASDGRV